MIEATKRHCQCKYSEKEKSDFLNVSFYLLTFSDFSMGSPVVRGGGTDEIHLFPAQT